MEEGEFRVRIVNMIRGRQSSALPAPPQAVSRAYQQQRKDDDTVSLAGTCFGHMMLYSYNLRIDLSGELLEGHLETMIVGRTKSVFVY